MTETSEPTSRGADPGLSTPLLALCSLVLVLLVYGQALGYGHIQDDALLLGGDRVADITTLPHALSRDLFWLAGDQVRTSPYWRPVTVVSYYVDQFWSGGAFWAGHLTNMLLLTGLGVVVGRQARSASVALLAAAVVIAHPMQVEAAVNITARTDLLVALFGTLAVLRGGLLGALFTALALGSKETALVVPLCAALRAWQDREGARGWFPHAVVTAVWLVVRQVLVGSWDVAPVDRGGPSWDGLSHLGSTLWLYLGRLLLPVHPVAARVLPSPRALTQAGGFAVLVVGMGLVLYRLAVSRRAPGRAALGLAIILLSLLPVCGLLSPRVRYAEGLLCWAIVGLGLVLGAVPRRLAVPLGVLVALGAVAARAHVPVWSSSLSLWGDAWVLLPGDPVVGLKLARARVAHPGAGDPWPPLRAALDQEADPRRLREAHALAASLLIAGGNQTAALPHLRVAALPGDPEAGWALAARCVLESPASMAPPALRDVCKAALALYPRDPELWTAAGIQAATMGDMDLAVERFGHAVALSPDDDSFRRNLEQAQAERAGVGQPAPVAQ